MARDPHHVPHPALPPRLLELDREAGARVRGLHAAARGGDGRGLRGPGPLPLLRVLGGHAHPDVLPHRDLGPRAAHLRRGEVLPLHLRRQRADARGVPGPLQERRPRHLRHPEARGGAGGPGLPDLALPGLRPRLRDQGADVAVPHLAARRARRGPDRGLGHPGRGAAEDGRLRLPPARHPALPGRGDALRPARGRPRGDRHRLRRARLAGAARPEEAGRLLVGVAPRLRDARHRGLHDHQRRGLGLPDAQPRHLDGGALLPRRHALRPAPHPAHLGVRRAAGGRALVLRGVPADQPLLDRGAGIQRVRGRVPDPARLVDVQPVDGGRLFAGGDPGRGLRPLDGQARLLRRGHEPEEPGAAGPLPARGDRPGAARRARDRHGDREPRLHAEDRALGRRPGAPGEGAHAGRPGGDASPAARGRPPDGEVR